MIFELGLASRKARHWFLYIAVFLPLTTSAEMQFEEVSTQLGMIKIQPSFGLAWGDLNSDGWPDLFINNHARKNTIYLNNGAGGFSDVTKAADGDNYWDSTGAYEDTHGGTWADYDNDGDQDLLITTGNCCDPQFFVNEDGVLRYRSIELGFGDDIDKGGRTPIWFDVDNDGVLEVALMSFYPAALMTQNSGVFTRIPFSKFKCQANQYAQLIDINADGHLDIICVAKGGKFAQYVYDTSAYPFPDVTDWLPGEYDANDTIVGDYDGNLRNDMLIVRGALRHAEVLTLNSRFLEAQLPLYDEITERGFSFVTTGVLQVDLDWNQTGNFTNIRIGANGVNPPSENFTLDPSNPDYWGIKEYTPKSYAELFIGYDPIEQRWTFTLHSPNKWVNSYFQIESSSAISDLTVSGIDGPDMPIKPVYLANLETGMENMTAGSAFDTPIRCVSGAAGDYDNDMDMDLYLVCRGGVQNIENRLYENLGDGTFSLVPGAGGAKGPEGMAVADHAGTGDSVALADYDADGLLDMFVVNGVNMRPHGETGGPYQFFHNVSNPRNWIEIDLVGTLSNRDAIGAKVYATAGGKTQLREQNGNFHRWSQNHQRVHFGLADNEFVDIEVNWPSGLTETFTEVAARKVYVITEGERIVERDLGGDSSIGAQCGKPAYNSGAERAVFIWQDCYGSGAWHLRATAGGSSSVVEYRGEITAESPFSSVSTYSFESGDFLAQLTNPPLIDFGLRMWKTGEDGINFSVDENANACLDLTKLPSGAQIFLGAARSPAPARLNLGTLEACASPPPPPLPEGACGDPAADYAADGALFIWKDCDADRWHVRSSSAAGYVKYIGNITSSQDFENVTKFSLERSDVLDNDIATRIDFTMGLTNPYSDGFNFSVSCDAVTTFNLTAPNGAPVLVGKNREPAPASFNLNDLGVCSTPP